MRGAALAAPELLHLEVGNDLRRLEREQLLTSNTAALAHADLLDLRLECWPYSTIAAETWRLRGSLTVHDGAYVARTAQVRAPLVTLDERWPAAASCAVLVPGRA